MGKRNSERGTLKGMFRVAFCNAVCTWTMQLWSGYCKFPMSCAKIVRVMNRVFRLNPGVAIILINDDHVIFSLGKAPIRTEFSQRYAGRFSDRLETLICHRMISWYMVPVVWQAGVNNVWTWFPHTPGGSPQHAIHVHVQSYQTVVSSRPSVDLSHAMTCILHHQCVLLYTTL